MTSIRIAIVTALAAASLFAGGSYTQHGTSAGVTLASSTSKAGPVTCCDE
jgi:hypothetical protein